VNVSQPARRDAPENTAILLARIGAYGTKSWAARIAELGLTLVQAEILRAVADGPGRSQQAISEQLSLLPSRVVGLVDGLEDRGILTRRRNRDDRRLHALVLTEAGSVLMRELARAERAHDRDLTAGLSTQQRAGFTEALIALAEHHGLAVYAGDRGGAASSMEAPPIAGRPQPERRRPLPSPAATRPSTG